MKWKLILGLMLIAPACLFFMGMLLMVLFTMPWILKLAVLVFVSFFVGLHLLMDWKTPRTYGLEDHLEGR